MQRTSAMMPPPELSVVLIAAKSCLATSPNHLYPFNDSRPGKSRGVAAQAVALHDLDLLGSTGSPRFALANNLHEGGDVGHLLQMLY